MKSGKKTATIRQRGGHRSVPDARVTEGLERLHDKYKTWPKLADKIGRSTSLIQFWREGRNTIVPMDAITLALLDETVDPDPIKRARHWLTVCNHKSIDSGWIESEVSKRTNLTSRIGAALDLLKELAESKGLTSGDFKMALGCYLGQQRLGEEIASWLAGTNGKGSTAVFWRWHSGLAARLMEDQTVSFVKSMITPEPGMRQKWAPAGIPSELKVLLFFQINEESGELKKVESLLEETVIRFRERLSLSDADRQRLVVYTTKERFAHPADCFAFVSPNSSTRGVLVSESNMLMRKVVNSRVEEMRVRPWDWCGQIIQIEGETIIERECLKPKSVTLNKDYAQLEVDSVAWTVLT